MNLEPHLARWREEMSRQGLGPGAVRDELESHLRDSIESAIQRGASEEVAIREAMSRLGRAEEIVQEFAAAAPDSKQPSLLFPTNLTFCAVASLVLGIYLAMGALLGPVFLAQWRGTKADVSAVSLIMGVTSVLGAVSALSHLRRPNKSSSIAVAAFTTLLLWMLGGAMINLLQGMLVPGLPLSPGIFFIGSLIGACFFFAKWRRRLNALPVPPSRPLPPW